MSDVEKKIGAFLSYNWTNIGVVWFGMKKENQSVWGGVKPNLEEGKQSLGAQ